MNHRCSIADAFLFTVVRWVSRIDLPLAEWLRVAACIARVAAHPLVVRTLEQEEG
jgi:glutathione S-transferase